MSDIVLDTHTFIWIMTDDPTLKQSTKDLIQKVCSQHFLLLSAISIWEIAMLEKKDRLSFSQPITQLIDRATSLPFLKVVQLDATITIESCHLPGDFHGGPADRMIIATARVLDLPLLTRDRKILSYAQSSHLKAIEC